MHFHPVSGNIWIFYSQRINNSGTVFISAFALRIQPLFSSGISRILLPGDFFSKHILRVLRNFIFTAVKEIGDSSQQKNSKLDYDEEVENICSSGKSGKLIQGLEGYMSDSNPAGSDWYCHSY